MTREELIASLIQEAYTEVSRYRCRFATDADAQLRELITAGVDRMSITERCDNFRIAEAKHNLRILCKKLCERTLSDHKLIVENRAFSSARLSICPLWPFC